MNETLKVAENSSRRACEQAVVAAVGKQTGSDDMTERR